MTPTLFPALARVPPREKLIIHLHFSGCQCARTCKRARVRAPVSACPCQRACVIVPVSACLCQRACVVVPVSACMCERACVSVCTERTLIAKIPSFLFYSSEERSIIPPPLGLSRLSFEMTLLPVAVLNLKISPPASVFSLKCVISRPRLQN